MCWYFVKHFVNNMARRTRMPVPIRIAIFLMVVIVCYVCYKIIHFINVNSDSVSIKRVYDGQSRSDILPVSPNDKQNRGDMYVVDENYKYMENEKLHRLDSQSQDVTADNKESFTDSDSDQYSDVDSKDPQRLRYISTVPESPFEVQKCPVCFGSSLCHRIGSGDAKFDLSVKQTSTNQKLYPGLYKHVKVTGKRLGTNAEFQKLDNFICVNTSQEVNCDVGDAVVMTYLASDEAFTVPHFRNELWKVAHTSKADLSATVCATDRFIDELKELYNKDRKGILNEEERARLMTSLILNPEGLLLKFFLETGYEEDIAWPFPQYIGECGRVVITEHAGKPLVQFLNASWEQRVALSLQLFDMVDTFLKGSSDWLVLFGDFRFSNFAVTDTGRVVVTNLKDILIVDKQETLKGIGSINYDRPCNEECFAAFVQKLLQSPESHCQEVYYYAQIMYALVCRWLLSVVEENEVDYMDNMENKVQTAGLLHDPPEAHKESILELLEECINETTPGGRLSAIEELVDLLQEIQYA